jgi:hypothetical protein
VEEESESESWNVKMKKISLLDVKQALQDERFVASLPESLKKGAEKYIKDPGCACNNQFIVDILKGANKELREYYPAATEVVDPDEEMEKLSKNNWKVFSCHVDELEGHLQKLPHGRKQIDMARWEDQVTVIVNELDIFW